MHSGYWHLETFWGAVIAILWIGYFVLEGFDFGVGTLLPFLGGSPGTDKRVMIDAVGPVWDGNRRLAKIALAAPPSPRFPAGIRRCFPASTWRYS